MIQFRDVIKPIAESPYGQLVIQSALVSSSTAIRLAAVTVFGIAMIKISDITTRVLNQAPWVGWIAEKINPALLVSRVDLKMNTYCEIGAFWIARKLTWHAIAVKDQEPALEHIAGQQYKAISEVKEYPKNGTKDDIKITPVIISRILMVSSLFKAVIALTAATACVRPALAFTEYWSPGIETWNAVSNALRIPVKVVL